MAPDPSAPPPGERSALRRALAEAHLPTLLMVHTHLTGDEALLDRLAPHIQSPYAQPRRAVPEPLKRELRERLEVLLASGAPGGRGIPDRRLMQKMMSVAVAEPVADEFVPLLLDQMGFEKPVARRERPERPLPPGDFKVLVIGAGLTGLLAGIKLGEAGYDFEILEKNGEVGGTWWENVYPGVGVDTPSHFYCYSFELNPEWSYYQPRGREMLDYLLRVTAKYGLREKIRLRTRVLACEFDDAQQRWRVTIQPEGSAPRVLLANAVINAHGVLNRWSFPDIPGIDAFRGVKLHSAAWDPDLVLEGARVALVGTGASAAQLGPEIAGRVAHLDVFQRSGHWVMSNPEIGKRVTEGVKWALRHIPHYAEWFRFHVYWFAADGLFPNVLKDPSWPHQERSVSAGNDAMREFALAHLRARLPGRPDLVEKLTPDCPIFSKRIVFDSGWFEMFNRPNVELVTSPIERITEDAIVTRDGAVHRVDVIAFATGFEIARMLGTLQVRGRGGRSLNDEWGADDPRAYLGITVPGYPNFFLTTGPNSAPNHAAGVNLISETQVHYIIECLDRMVAEKAATFETTQEAYAGWNAEIERRMPQMIWTHPKANSYYNNARGRVFLSLPFRLVDYWTLTRAPAPGSYVLGPQRA